MKHFLFVLLLCSSPLALAGWTNGNELNTDLNSSSGNFFSSGFASGYVSAIADDESASTAAMIKMLGEMESIAPQKKRELLMGYSKNLTCFPKGVTRGQLVAVVKKWLASNPDRWNENASGLVQDALRDGFPCKTPKDFLK